MDITAILLAAAASFVIGAVWYAFLFAKPYRRLMGIPEGASMKGMGRTMALGFVLDLVRAYVLIQVVAAMGAFSVATGAEAGFWVWLGFVLTTYAGAVVYEKRSIPLAAINAGYYLVAYLVMGAIVAVW